MKPRKKGQQYEISYRCPGYPKPFYERFSSFEEANLHIAQIEYEKSLGVFQPPKPVPTAVRAVRKKYITVGELMDDCPSLWPQPLGRFVPLIQSAPH